jgi:hypothetical protein|tara:strand:+ start:45 stop:221 length:177 start_codon:yes stop_codon:yes gene_type:complete
MVKKMAKNQRMAKLIEYLANLELIDYDRMSKEGQLELAKIWNLLGMSSQEELNKKDKK